MAVIQILISQARPDCKGHGGTGAREAEGRETGGDAKCEKRGREE